MIFDNDDVIEIIKFAATRGYEMRVFRDDIEINVYKFGFMHIYLDCYSDIVIVYKQSSASERVISSDELKDLLDLWLSA
ncbi:hypothetical protein F2G11_19375 [Salmonella enterica]|uniref:Uncharacterized protein n=1 Tax=Salmonella enterica TaxID=28901 RepID=A0A5Z4EM91_SALER|nr:hypothetical protein [Salmonella enterica]